MNGTEFNISLAWEINKKFSNNLPQHINSYSFERLLIERNLDDWLNCMEADIDKGYFHPQKADFFREPKKNGAFRNSCILGLSNALYYTYIILQAFPLIIRKCQEVTLQKSDLVSKQYQKKVFNNIADAKLNMGRMVKVSKKYKFVCKTDITDYSSSINISMLKTNLEHIGIDSFIIGKLNECLSLWAEDSNTGIPLTYWGTDILGEVYMLDIDKELIENDIVYTRKSDDIWIYAEKESEIPQKIKLLKEILSKKALQLNSDKISIIPVSKIKTRQNAFRKYFSLYNTFYYFKELILFNLQEDILKNPSKISLILKGTRNNKNNRQIITDILMNHNISDYQQYFLIKWLTDNYCGNDEKLIDFIVDIAKSKKHYLLKSICRKFMLDIHYDDKLINTIKNELISETDSVKLAELICLLQEDDLSIYSLPNKDNLIIKYATEFVINRNN